MIEYKDRLGNLFCISSDVYHQLQDEKIPLKEHCAELATYMFRENITNLRLLHAVATKPEKVILGVLDAHGVSSTNQHYDPDEWRYFDAKPVHHSIQSWIDRMDGQFTALLIYACNPGENLVVARRSLVLHTAANTFAAPADHIDPIQHAYIPTVGYLHQQPNAFERFMKNPVLA